jgi:uncharacterized protein YbjT (DUF2867 family)
MSMTLPRETRNMSAVNVASLQNPAAQRALIEVGGPEALTPPDAVRIFEQESGRSFEVEHVPDRKRRHRKMIHFCGQRKNNEAFIV